MSYGLDSLKGFAIKKKIMGVNKGDTRCLDYSSYEGISSRVPLDTHGDMYGGSKWVTQTSYKDHTRSQSAVEQPWR